MSIRTIYAKGQDAYLNLIRKFPLRPIRSEEELGEAIAVVDELIDRNNLTPAEGDYLEVLGDLIRQYELENHPIPKVSDSELLRFLIEVRELTQARIAKMAGIAESTISEVLSGRRKLNRRHISKLAGVFRVEPGAFLGAE
jgi:HTH-type transcriptional regulator / antitoxin HigA